MKKVILTGILTKLSSMGIKYKTGEESDIIINTQFLDAGWSTGNKRIVYEAAVFANEDENTVYMYEKTVETGSGLLASSATSTSFQSGKTLFRKVKSTGYGPDGKAFEYTFDIGAIPKAVKETAKEYGWKFKTVLKRKKACYPEGYSSTVILPKIDNEMEDTSHCDGCGANININAKFCSSCGKAYNTTTAKQFENSYVDYTPVTNPAPKKNSPKGTIGFILLAIISILMLLIFKASLAGWISSAVIFLIGYVIFKKASGKGCITSIIIWIITALLLIISALVFSEGEINYTTANIKNGLMTTAVDEQGKPLDNVVSYNTDAERFIVSAELRNAPQQTKITFVWIYLSENEIITDFELDSGENDPDIYIYSFLTNETPWPIGDYAVEIYIENREKPDEIVMFTVK